ncbi:hypothetical protein EF847_12590 [Actinobacteria bacterium YIM 96077]|uniref:Universal stress protein n=1 Tax=Phytoactinopolyspora halophila TaxID=1981511 RepID=A0A329QZ00_9ACTN|nr:hypothetical protein [Phytoactinopolyspora halophila]AYY13402.1 hypothetical protein EF847_12590 [Actinobacteria bacterium YIM 96077]RAW17363.1 hypothetical protein DPM12_04845 [Phytoactinopolyspora halophila]
MSYKVVVLVEQPVTSWDARQIVALHADVPDTVHYYVLIPVEDAATRVEATIGSLAASEVMGTAALYLDEEDLERVHHEIREASRQALDTSVTAFGDQGVRVTGEITAADPLERLASLVDECGAAEVIILTRPHLVAEFFHVDWTNRARRKLKVPVLHLLAQSEPDWESEARHHQEGNAEL